MTAPVLQSRLPILPWMDPRTLRLPGIQPVAPGDWLRIDDAYAGQMALRDTLIAEREAAVHGLLPEAIEPADELYDLVLAELAHLPGFQIADDHVIRPDGARIDLDRSRPLLTLGQLIQDDLCILQRGDADAEHRLTAAILCFPASWTLAQKLGHGMLRIHVPVKVYDADLAKRVQRLFDAIRPEQPLWRMNFLSYHDHELHWPRTEEAPRLKPVRDGKYVRCERQVLLRLPRTRAIVFSIHTYVVLAETLTREERDALDALKHD